MTDSETTEERRRLSWLEIVAALALAFAVVAGLILVLQQPFRSLEGFVTPTAQRSSGQEQIPTGVTDDGFPYKGAADAPVTLIEYADFQCPFCKNFSEDTAPTIEEQYISTGQVKWVFRDFPFLGPESLDASEAAHCAKDQGKFWAYHDLLWDNQGAENSGAFSRGNLEQFAQQLNLDMGSFGQCLDSEKYAEFVRDSRLEARTQGAEATPTFFVDGEMIEGAQSFSRFRQVIENQLGETE